MSLSMKAKDRLLPVYAYPRLLTALTISIVTAVVFLPAVWCGFVNWDDGPYVYENKDVLAGLSPQTVWNAWTEITFLNWAPLTTLSFLTDTSLFGTRPWGYHLTNVILHAAASGLLLLAIARMTGCFWQSVAATLLFALHPLRVESVAWIAERKDVLSVFFLAIALVAYERYCRQPNWPGRAAVAAAMTASLLSKATIVTLPGLLLLLDVWPLGRISDLAPVAVRSPAPYPKISLRTAIAEKLPLLTVSLLFAVITLSTQTAAIKRPDGVSLLAVRLPLGLWSIVRYLGMTVWPIGLHPAYCHPGSAAVTPLIVAGGIAGLLAIGGIVLATRRSHPAVAIGLTWFVVALAPVLGIVTQQGIQSHADRFTYVPHIGLAMAVVWLVAELTATSAIARAIAWAGFVGLLALCIMADERQISRWHDSDTLWRWIISVDARNYIANKKLGHRLVEAKDYEAGRRHYLAALDWIDMVGELEPGEAGDVYAKLAHVEFDTGNHVLARRYRDRAIAEAVDGQYTQWVVKHMRIGPRREPVEALKLRLRAGLADAREGRLPQAIETFAHVLAADPECGDAANNLGLALGDAGRPQEAVTALARAVGINPLNADYRLNLAQALAAVGRIDEAIAECRFARELDPTDEGIRVAERTLAARRK